MSELQVRVVGVPAPQGSKRHVGNGVLVESSKKVAPWRKAVAFAVRVALNDRQDISQFTGPVSVTTTYYLPRPKSVRRLLPSVPPDLDKLDRGLYDALTLAGVWKDDALVVESYSSKRYAPDEDSVGALVLITEIGAE